MRFARWAIRSRPEQGGRAGATRGPRKKRSGWLSEPVPCCLETLRVGGMTHFSGRLPDSQGPARESHPYLGLCHFHGRKWRAGSTPIRYLPTVPLDFDACYRALCARNARFDGLFFVGVKTTGIYCRPVCTARTPLARSCLFLDTPPRPGKPGRFCPRQSFSRQPKRGAPGGRLRRNTCGTRFPPTQTSTTHAYTGLLQ